MTDRATDHWRGTHYDADRITGPVAFLNPTTRFLSVQGQQRRRRRRQQQHHHQHDSQGVPVSGGSQSGSAASPRPDASPDGRGGPDDKDASGETTPPEGSHPGSSGVYTVWRSRDNRKGRHTLALTPSAAAALPTVPTKTTSAASTTAANIPRLLLSGLARMALRYPLHDVSYDVALVFTLGSLIWVLNGFFVLLPLLHPDVAADNFPGESAWGGGVTAVVGATVFELGSVLLMLEAVNEDRAGCFGWALRRGEEDLLASLLVRRDGGGGRAACRHHHADRRHWLRSGEEEEGDEGGNDADDRRGPGAGRKRRWTWWPSWYELRTHYLRDIGFLACLSQMFGATVFWISGFTGLPPILDVLSLPAENGIYWLPQVRPLPNTYSFPSSRSYPDAPLSFDRVAMLPPPPPLAPISPIGVAEDHLPTYLPTDGPTYPSKNISPPARLTPDPRTTPQVVGGSGFIVSSWLFMLETQKRWYLPAPTVLGWHIGLWNLVGAMGFTLCGALGFASSSSDACEIALTWSTFIGSWAFLVSFSGFIKISKLPPPPYHPSRDFRCRVFFSFYIESVVSPLFECQVPAQPAPYSVVAILCGLCCALSLLLVDFACDTACSFEGAAASKWAPGGRLDHPGSMPLTALPTRTWVHTAG